MTGFDDELLQIKDLIQRGAAQGRDALSACAKTIRDAFNEHQALDLLRSEIKRGELRPGSTGKQGEYDIVGTSGPMKKVYELISKVLPSSYPVLIQGESGTGKELVARALHKYGPRHGKPFVSDNCAAIPETLLESELFGHKKGAFTGAVVDRKGHFETADKGSIFLDEIGDMSAAMQTKLLRVLQDGEVRAVGGDKAIHVDVRVIAASNKDLRELVGKKLFREDLYFRLNVITIYLPPLRERKEDIPLLVDHFLRKAAIETNRELTVTPAAMKVLQKHRWPGNVRELENEIRRGVALCDDTIDFGDLSVDVRN
ncbi:MAG: sigma-54 interaction domain-containing protein [Planctomycetota bacterium]